MRAAAAAFAAALCVLAALAASASAASFTGSIAGTVTDLTSGEPIEGVEACIWPLAWSEAVELWWETEGGCEETGADGAYEFSGVPAGEYELEFWPPGPEYRAAFREVTLEAGQDLTVDVEMERLGTISGAVSAAAGGAPLSGVAVCAYGAEYYECAESEAGGAYTIEGLPSGRYKVEFWPGWLEPDFAYQYWDHKSLWTQADQVEVASGATVPNIDGSLEPGATISGTVTTAGGAPLEEIPVCALETPGNAIANCTYTGAGGAYRFRHFPAGDYRVAFSFEWTEFFPEAEDTPDGYDTQFYDGQATLAAATLVHLDSGATAAGIDAHLTSSATPPIVVVPPLTPTPSPTVPSTKPKHKRCRHGFRRKKVKGVVRCVRIHRRRHHHRHRHRAPAARLAARR